MTGKSAPETTLWLLLRPFEARYADPHVCRVAELLQPYGDQADDGAHNDDARRCRKKIFPHLLLLPKRFGGYTMRTMAPS